MDSIQELTQEQVFLLQTSLEVYLVQLSKEVEDETHLERQKKAEAQSLLTLLILSDKVLLSL